MQIQKIKVQFLYMIFLNNTYAVLQLKLQLNSPVKSNSVSICHTKSLSDSVAKNKNKINQLT
jgi:hypothetical protein